MNHEPRTAVYPGSFDPLTNGHLDVVVRALGIFDQLIVAVAANPEKREPLFTVEERMSLISAALKGKDRVEVASFTGLTVEYARSRGATVFMSSHVLSEVEHVCDRVGIVREGHLATVGTLDQLTGIRAHHVRIEFAGAPPADRLQGLKGFEGLAIEGRQATGLYRGSFDELLGAVAGSAVNSFESREPTLEEVFLSYYSGAKQ
jgi:cytidyltransferase-like protein